MPLRLLRILNSPAPFHKFLRILNARRQICVVFQDKSCVRSSYDSVAVSVGTRLLIWTGKYARTVGRKLGILSQYKGSVLRSHLAVLIHISQQYLQLVGSFQRYLSANYLVVDLGVNGYGNVAALIDIQEALLIGAGNVPVGGFCPEDSRY